MQILFAWHNTTQGCVTFSLPVWVATSVIEQLLAQCYMLVQHMLEFLPLMSGSLWWVEVCSCHPLKGLHWNQCRIVATVQYPESARLGIDCKLCLVIEGNWSHTLSLASHTHTHTLSLPSHTHTHTGFSSARLITTSTVCSPCLVNVRMWVLMTLCVP